MTVTFDSPELDDSIASHSIFRFTNVKEAHLENCRIYQNQKFKILSLVNLARGNYYNQINVTSITMNNLTIINNIGDHVNRGSQSLFSFYNPMKPLSLVFSNILFENNSLGKFLNVLSCNKSFRNKSNPCF